MKVSQSLVAAAGLVGVASAQQRWDKRWENGTVWTTEVVTAYTTYCPGATTVVANNKTYTVTEATTLTITNCPCTISSIVTPSVSTGPTVVPVGPAISPTSSPAPHAGQTSVAPPPGHTSVVPPAGKTTSAPSPSHVQVAGAAMVGSSFAAIILGGAIALLL